ncbi:MAG TPA: hypothetical protein PLD84_16375, partial [Chitinophagales bacterium]|nr:hypothetical protein [Chitinophagales bacterium]
MVSHYAGFLPHLRTIAFASLFAITALMSGCLIGGKYTAPPRSGIDSTYRYPNQASTDSITLLRWTDLYRDSTLQQLIRTTLDSNRNLLTAAARVEESREIAGAVKAQLFPSLNYSAGAGYGSVGSTAEKWG